MMRDAASQRKSRPDWAIAVAVFASGLVVGETAAKLVAALF